MANDNEDGGKPAIMYRDCSTRYTGQKDANHSGVVLNPDCLKFKEKTPQPKADTVPQKPRTPVVHTPIDDEDGPLTAPSKILPLGAKPPAKAASVVK